MSETQEALKFTALHHKHVELGAKMVPFAGYDMPVSYTGVNDEHIAVRTGVGVFDVSHMGEFRVKGPGALDLIQRVTSNDASKLFDGKVQYSCLPNGQGGIVDDLLVYRISADDYILVVNASNLQKDWDWIQKHNTYDCELTDFSDNTTLLAVQGPKAAEAIQSLTSVNLSEMNYYTFEIADFAGKDNIIISTTGYTGAGGFEIYIPNEHANQVWNAIFEAGKSVGIRPIGLAARDTLRLEMGFCLYGNDIDDTTSPIEAGLSWITKFTKDFIDREYNERQKTNGVERKLVGFEMIDRGIPRHGYEIENENGELIGVVTSGTMSPSLNLAIGMGYVTVASSSPESTIGIRVRNKSLSAKVVKLPFYKG
jgi:aminomethyltransferase